MIQKPLSRRNALLGAGAGLSLALLTGRANAFAAYDSAAMRANIVGFVNFLIRTVNATAAGEWYAGVLRLPIIRGREPTIYLWAGGVRIVELLAAGSVLPPERLNDPASAPCTPVFRTRKLDSLIARLQKRGVDVVHRVRGPFGKEAFVRDPDGNLLGFRQPGSAGRAAREADFNPGTSMLPPDIDGLDWIVRRVADVSVAARFYQEVLGLTQLPTIAGRARFDLGFGTTLELAPGGVVEPLPKSRTEVPATFIVRVEDHDAANRWLKANKVAIIDDALKMDSAELTYFADPEGHIVGIDERYEASEFKSARRPFAEDLEIERRWKARQNLKDGS